MRDWWQNASRQQRVNYLLGAAAAVFAIWLLTSAANRPPDRGPVAQVYDPGLLAPEPPVSAMRHVERAAADEATPSFGPAADADADCRYEGWEIRDVAPDGHRFECTVVVRERREKPRSVEPVVHCFGKRPDWPVDCGALVE